MQLSEVPSSVNCHVLRLTVLETGHVTGCSNVVSDEKEPLASPIEDFDNSCDELLPPLKALQQFLEGPPYSGGPRNIGTQPMIPSALLLPHMLASIIHLSLVTVLFGGSGQDRDSISLCLRCELPLHELRSRGTRI